MLDILFVTDYVCPYCLVAKEALKQAMAETGILADIRIAPMELTPPPKERVDTYSDPVRRSHYQVLVEPAKELGLDMKLPPAIIPRPYTHTAFLGRFYAISKRKEAAYNDLMYKAYFIEEKDIGDLAVLCDLVTRIGLDPEEYKTAVTDGRYENAQAACNSYAREELKVSGIPTIYIDDKPVTLETYTKDEMIDILESFNQPAPSFFSASDDEDDENEDDENSAPAFTGCGPDGC